MQSKNIKDFLKDGQTIMISGIDSSYYPKKLINEIKESGVKDLTLIYIEDNSELDPAGDPMDLILNGQVRKLVTSHLGYLAKTFRNYLEEVELVSMGSLAFRMQAGANNIPGIVLPLDLVKIYRSKEYLEENSNLIIHHHDGDYIMEPALNADISIVDADNFDPDSHNVSYNGTTYNGADVARAGKICFVEYHQEKKIGYDDVDIPSAYVDGFVKSDFDHYTKTNWE
jgi:acetate CoA/acetoacetate CoA-transferase alpha subunit